MVTIMPAAPIDGVAVLPDELVEQYVKPDGDQFDLIDAFRIAALGWVENHTRRSLERRDWVAQYDSFSDIMRLAREPAHAVQSISYINEAGSIVDVTDWRLFGVQLFPATGMRWPATFACPGAVIVTFEAGYDDVASEAPGLQIAALLLMAHLRAGGSLNDVPATVTMLLDAQYRTPVIG